MIQIPIYNQLNVKTWENHVSWGSCNAFADIIYKRNDMKSTFEDYAWMTDAIKPGIEVQLNLDKADIKKFNLYNWYIHADEVESQRYHRTPQKYNWTPYEEKQIELEQMLGIILPMNDLARQLFVSRNLWTPIRHIEEIAKNPDSLKDGTVPKYFV